MRSTVVLLAVAATGYVAAALVHDALPHSNGAAVFARPVRAAETNAGDTLRVPATLGMVPDAEWTESPRECDLGKGISTECIFMD